MTSLAKDIEKFAEALDPNQQDAVLALLEKIHDSQKKQDEKFGNQEKQLASKDQQIGLFSAFMR